VLPQLAATGIERASCLREKTGWNAVPGPVYAKDLPAYLGNGYRETPAMREVRFLVRDRIQAERTGIIPLNQCVLIPGITAEQAGGPGKQHQPSCIFKILRIIQAENLQVGRRKLF
jgi:hypothetical protein